MNARRTKFPLVERQLYLGELPHVLDVDGLATMGRDEVETAAEAREKCDRRFPNKEAKVPPNPDTHSRWAPMLADSGHQGSLESTSYRSVTQVRTGPPVERGKAEKQPGNVHKMVCSHHTSVLPSSAGASLPDFTSAKYFLFPAMM